MPSKGLDDFTIRLSRINICSDSQGGFSALVLAPKEPQGYFPGPVNSLRLSAGHIHRVCQDPWTARESEPGFLDLLSPPPTQEAAALPVPEVSGTLRHHILVKSMVQVPGPRPGGPAQACGTGRQFTSTVTHHKVSSKCKGAKGQDRRPFSLTREADRAPAAGWDRPALPVLTTMVEGNSKTFLQTRQGYGKPGLPQPPSPMA